MIHKRPALIARCENVADVIAAVEFARENDLDLAIHGGYVNFIMEEGQDRIQATCRDNYRRLVTVKRHYDPDNLFCVNQNIKPG